MSCVGRESISKTIYAKIDVWTVEIYSKRCKPKDGRNIENRVLVAFTPALQWPRRHPAGPRKRLPLVSNDLEVTRNRIKVGHGFQEPARNVVVSKLDVINVLPRIVRYCSYYIKSFWARGVGHNRHVQITGQLESSVSVQSAVTHRRSDEICIYN